MPETGPFLSLLIILAFVIPDIDYLISKMHRNLFTHTPIFLFTIAVFLSLISPNMWFFIPAFFIHMLLDTLDYGIMLKYPMSRAKYGKAVLGKEADPCRTLLDFIKQYFKNSTIITIEFILMFLSIFALVISS